MSPMEHVLWEVELGLVEALREKGAEQHEVMVGAAMKVVGGKRTDRSRTATSYGSTDLAIHGVGVISINTFYDGGTIRTRTDPVNSD